MLLSLPAPPTHPQYFYLYWPQTTEERMRGESAPSFCHQLVVLFPDMSCNFCLVKIHKIANNSATTQAREKYKH